MLVPPELPPPHPLIANPASNKTPAATGAHDFLRRCPVPKIPINPTDSAKPTA
jgi:hypothetical protein